MLTHELPVPILVTAVQVAEMVAIPLELTQVEKLCPYLCPLGERVRVRGVPGGGVQRGVSGIGPESLPDAGLNARLVNQLINP
jgi:hypothetical protein